MADWGLVQVYTGNGKGKTTASLGLALRACGHGFKVCMIQFMKEDPEYGEIKAAGDLPGLKVIQVGRNDFVNLSNPEAIDIQLAQAGWDVARETIHSGEYDIVILDEINIAVACKLIPVESVVAFLTQFKKQTAKKPEIILTGRYAPQPMIDLADLVTEMREIRHYYQQGISSRKGVDY